MIHENWGTIHLSILWETNSSYQGWNFFFLLKKSMITSQFILGILKPHQIDNMKMKFLFNLDSNAVCQITQSQP